MKLSDALDAISTNGQPAKVYSQPYQTADGATIITVSKVRAKLVAGEEVELRAKPVGVFVVRGDKSKWEPAVDATPIALIGVITGLVAATLGTLAMVRRPPWPDIKIDNASSTREALSRLASLRNRSS
ncbi:MAG: hypothetical protein QOH60_735 [Mycobacterium sp.]|jgi:hypothetical protein|nr:hypothetical protein [Mycobacterium sp.]